MAVLELQDATFGEELTKIEGLTVVDFWAPWCGPCRTVAPIIEELSEELQGKVSFAKVNVDENQGVAQKYGVRSIPTLAFFQNGEAVGGLVGAYPKAALLQAIDQVQEKIAQEA